MSGGLSTWISHLLSIIYRVYSCSRHGKVHFATGSGWNHMKSRPSAIYKRLFWKCLFLAVEQDPTWAGHHGLDGVLSTCFLGRPLWMLSQRAVNLVKCIQFVRTFGSLLGKNGTSNPKMDSLNRKPTQNHECWGYAIHMDSPLLLQIKKKWCFLFVRQIFAALSSLSLSKGCLVTSCSLLLSFNAVANFDVAICRPCWRPHLAIQTQESFHTHTHTHERHRS